MKKQTILITGSVTGADEQTINFYNGLISLIDLEKFNIESPLDTMQFQGTDTQRYARGLEIARDSELIIAEVSKPSHGQGIELFYASELGIPILAIARKGSKVSGMVNGFLATNNNPEVIYYENIEDVKEKVTEFILEYTK